MARRSVSEELIQATARIPWWSALLLAVGSYVIFAWVLPATVGGPYQNALDPIFRLAGFAFAGLCLIGMVAGLISRAKQRSILLRQSSLDSIRALSWREFEHLMTEAFRREGFAAHVSDYGPDGGVDIRLSCDGQTHLVQCKQWQRQKVGVRPVRELAGVVASEGAAGGIFVSSGTYTSEALAFAEKAGLRCIDGAALAEMLNVGEPDGPIPLLESLCPRCGSDLVRRTAKRGANAGKSFLGCAAFPECRYTQSVSSGRP